MLAAFFCTTVNVFQFTPLREGRRIGMIMPSPYAVFQFTPLREGRRPSPAMPVKFFDFNSRPSARGDMKYISSGGSTLVFQFTPLREGRPLCSISQN